MTLKHLHITIKSVNMIITSTQMPIVCHKIPLAWIPRPLLSVPRPLLPLPRPLARTPRPLVSVWSGWPAIKIRNFFSARRSAPVAGRDGCPPRPTGSIRRGAARARLWAQRCPRPVARETGTRPAWPGELLRPGTSARRILRTHRGGWRPLGQTARGGNGKRRAKVV